MDREWHGKTVVITGGSSGIGLALAERFAAAGANLVLASKNASKLESAVRHLGERGAPALTVQCDVTKRGEVYALAKKTVATFGPVELLCANAGATTVGRYVDHADDDWDWAIDTNLRGVIHALQAFYPNMVARRSGKILITGSQTALVPDWVLGHGPYVAAKAALLGLAFALRAEAAQADVKVSLLLPAYTATTIAETARPVGPGTGAMVINEASPPPDPHFPFALSPDEVAARAIAGLRVNAPIIVTHAAMRPLVEEYFGRILAAYDAAANFSDG
jgi:short-subunit dehydrogenase